MYTKSLPYSPYFDCLHGEIRMVGIIDPNGNEICIVPEKQADDILAHLNHSHNPSKTRSVEVVVKITMPGHLNPDTVIQEMDYDFTFEGQALETEILDSSAG